MGRAFFGSISYGFFVNFVMVSMMDRFGRQMALSDLYIMWVKVTNVLIGVGSS